MPPRGGSAAAPRGRLQLAPRRRGAEAVGTGGVKGAGAVGGTKAGWRLLASPAVSEQRGCEARPRRREVQPGAPCPPLQVLSWSGEQRHTEVQVYKNSSAVTGQ